MSGARTNFAAYSHQQLYAMLQAGDPSTARTAAEQWKAAGIGLTEQAENLSSELTDFDGNWTGGAADKYKTMVTDLINGIKKVGQTASDMQNMLDDAADALVKAKAEMPPPVDVPDVSPAQMELAVNPPVLPADTSQASLMNAAKLRQDAITSVDAQQQAAGAASAAQAKAIVVMTTLAGDYTTAEDSIPASPNAPATPPTVTGGGATGGGAAIGSGMPSIGTTAPTVTTDLPPLNPGTGLVAPGGTAVTPPPSSSLFGDMFTAGLAAASAAAFGRFGSIMPKVPPWASGKNPDDEKDPKPGAKLGEGANLGGTGGGADVGGGGGGGGPIGSPSIGGGGAPGAAPVAHTGLAGAPDGGNTLSGLAGSAAGAAGAAASKSMMPMMPMMPMGGGAGDLGGGRRIPPWLVETEDVWGQSAPIAPSVIGADPELY